MMNNRQQQHHHHHHHDQSPMSSLESQSGSLATPLLRYTIENDDDLESGSSPLLMPRSVPMIPSTPTSNNSNNHDQYQHDCTTNTHTSSITDDRDHITAPTTTTEIRRRSIIVQQQPRSRNIRAALNAPSTVHQQQRYDSRILDRDGGFFQSRGKWNVERLSRREARIGLGLGPGLCPCTTSSSASSSFNSSDSGSSSYCCGCFFQRILQFRFRRPWDDWFHTLAYKPTWVLMLILFVSYTAIVTLFAYLYYALSVFGASVKEQPDGSIIKLSFCDMDINNQISAMYFSLSTMTTIGYGVSDYYFGDCYTPLIVVLSQVCCAITFDAVAIGLLFQKISRGNKRGRTIIFSNDAILRRVKGVPYLMFRIAELRKHQLVEANVRAYCIRHERFLIQPRQPQPQQQQQRQQQHQLESTAMDNNNNNDTNTNGINISSSSNTIANHNDNDNIETVYFVTRSMKLLHPADEAVGSHILMCLPQVIVHRLDDTSPLVPPCPLWYDKSGTPHTTIAPTEPNREREMETNTARFDRNMETDTALTFHSDDDGGRLLSSPKNTSKKVPGTTNKKVVKPKVWTPPHPKQSRMASLKKNTSKKKVTGSISASRQKSCPPEQERSRRRRSHPQEQQLQQQQYPKQEQQQQQQQQQHKITKTMQVQPKNFDVNSDIITNSNNEIKAFLHDREIEIVVLVEGTDELTGCAIQARHSYTYNDFKWDHTFQPCAFPSSVMTESSESITRRGCCSYCCDIIRLCCSCFFHCCCCCCIFLCRKERQARGGTVGAGDGCWNEDEGPKCVVDFSKFHNTKEVPLDCEACPYVPS